MMRYSIVSMCALALGLSWIACVGAQTYPTKPIRIMTAGVGGGSDFMSRLIAQGIAGPLGQQVIVDNRAGEIIPIEIALRALPDGYTLLLMSSSLWLGPLLNEKAPFNAMRDFAPISWTARTPAVLVVHPAMPVKSVRELIALAKAKPGALSYASASTGTANHLSAEMFKAMAGVDIVRIAYKSGASQISDLISGQVQLTFGTVGTVAPYIKSGRLTALAVTSAEPTALFPSLPTIAASGLPDYESIIIHAIFAPAKTPVDVLDQLNRQIVAVLTAPDYKDKALTAGVETVGSSREQLTAKLKSEIARWGKVIKSAGIHAE